MESIILSVVNQREDSLKMIVLSCVILKNIIMAIIIRDNSSKDQVDQSMLGSFPQGSESWRSAIRAERGPP